MSNHYPRTRANRTDAGNGSKAICRVSNVLRSLRRIQMIRLATIEVGLDVAILDRLRWASVRGGGF